MGQTHLFEGRLSPGEGVRPEEFVIVFQQIVVNQPTIVQGDAHVSGDTFKGGIVQRDHGTVYANQATITQSWNEIKDQIDLPTLAIQLEKLRRELRKAGTTAEEDDAIAAIGKAQKAAEDGKGEEVIEKLSLLQTLKKAGIWALDKAKDIAADMAVKILQKAIGL